MSSSESAFSEVRKPRRGGHISLQMPPQTRQSLWGKQQSLLSASATVKVYPERGCKSDVHTQDNSWRLVPVNIEKSHRKDRLELWPNVAWPHDHLCIYNPSLLSASPFITGLGGDYRRSPAMSDWPPDSLLQRSRTSGPACPLQQGSPRWHAVPQGSVCAACHQRWAVGRMGLDALDGVQCLSSLEGVGEQSKKLSDKLLFVNTAE